MHDNSIGPAAAQSSSGSKKLLKGSSASSSAAAAIGDLDDNHNVFQTTSITWDEKVIAEHDRERGTRMKINEPNTPYYMSSATSMDSEETDPFNLDGESKQHREVDELHQSNMTVNAEEVRKRLEEVQDRREKGLQDEDEGEIGNNSSDEDFRANSKRRKKEFEARRKAHYNEFVVMKELRSNGSLEIDEEQESSE